MPFESVTSKNNWLISVLMASFSIRYKTQGPEKKSNTDSNLFMIWLPEGKLTVSVRVPIFASSSMSLRLMMVMAVSLIVHYISVILIYSFCHKARSLWKNGCLWVIYILSAYTPYIRKLTHLIISKWMLEICYCKIFFIWTELLCSGEKQNTQKSQTKQQNKYKLTLSLKFTVFTWNTDSQKGLG